MKRALVITVGAGPKVDNAIVFSIRHHNPNMIMFCCSNQTAGIVDKVKKNLDKELSNVTIIIKESSEVNDLESIFDTYCDYIFQLRKLGFEINEIVADYTSGTKAMSAALAIAAIMNRIYSICYVYSDYRNSVYGRSVTVGMKASSLTPNLIYTKQRLDFARKYFNKFQYNTAIDLLMKDIHPKFEAESKWLNLVASAYQAWDIFHFQKARDLFGELLNHQLSMENGLEETFMMNKKHLGKLQHQSSLYENIVIKNLAKEPEALDETTKGVLTNDLVCDLIDNSCRRSKEGKYEDAVARLYRALELLAQIAFIKATGFANTNVPSEKLPLILQEHFTNIIENKKISISLFQTYRALAILQDNCGMQFISEETTWLTMVGKRNSSILAHGLNTVAKEDFESFLTKIKQFLPSYSSMVWPEL